MSKHEETTFEGARLRVIPGPDDRPPVAQVFVGRRWAPAPLRTWVKAFPVGEGPWPWLLSQGIWRPQPSGKVAEADRTGHRVNLRLSDEAVKRLDELVARWGVTRTEAIERALALVPNSAL